MMFNEYGNFLGERQDISQAQMAYMTVLRPYLEKMTIVEVKAFFRDVSMDSEFAEYILGRQVRLRKENKRRDGV